MNIQEAKQEVIHAVQAYTAKDQEGNYKIAQIRQRPILLMGPPGIGKTAIVEQVARECGIGLVAYTITHHTRQSAVGLPMVEKRRYDGREVTVTEYTMSEIIASVYDCMEKNQCTEGILFIDEVNCVSETLAPTMLQFLQGKTFGNHRVPKGWVIVAAGNPVEYNKSVREFDVVTLDRVKKIDIAAEYEAWRAYAVSHEIHGAIRTYLDGNPQYFYHIEQTPEKKEFVTARGWEDLSVILKQYEEMRVEIKENLICQYIQCEEIARSFASFYQFYEAYHKKYQDGIQRLLQGEMVMEGMQDCILDEQLTVTNLLISQVLNHVSIWKQAQKELQRLKEAEQLFLQQNQIQKEQVFAAAAEKFCKNRKQALEVKEQMELITEDQLRIEKKVDRMLQQLFDQPKIQGIHNWEKAMIQMKLQIDEWDARMEKDTEKTAEEIQRVLCWLEQTFGIGTAFLTAMEIFTRHESCMELISVKGCQAYVKHSDLLMMKDREKMLRKQIEQVYQSEL